MKKNLFGKIASILNFIISIIFIVFVNKINILPIKYFYLLAVILIIINIIFLILTFFMKNKIIKVITDIFIFIFIIMNSLGIYFINKTNSFLYKSFSNKNDLYEITYYVISSESSDKITNLNKSDIAFYQNSNEIKIALNKLQKKIKFNSKEYNEFSDLLNDFETNNIKHFVIEQTLYEALFSSNSSLAKEKYNIIYKFNIKVKETKKSLTETIDGEILNKNLDSVNIYIGGTDFTNQFYDFNMIVTINNKTHKVLLTSIPRDYYVTIADKGVKDLLGYHGVYGINSSKRSLENLFGINIDYFIKINTNSLVALVDNIDGINYCSDQEYITTHSLILNSYDDSKGKKFRVIKGCQNINGIQALTIARERKAFAGGDRVRQQNCQKIIISIIDKITQIDTLKNYNAILNSIYNLYTTDIPIEFVTDNIKSTLENGNKYQIETQSVNGTDSTNKVHLGTVTDYVMEPNYDTVNEAKSKIIKIMNQK